jgi:hypothetical protein
MLSGGTIPARGLAASCTHRNDNLNKRSLSNSHYSGKKQQHTLKSQITVDSDRGRIVDVSDSVPGPTADIKLMEDSGLLERLPEEVGLGSDLAYLKLAKLRRYGFSPRRKPRGKDRPSEDGVYNRAFSQFRIVVEQTIGQVRRFQSVTATRS